VLESAGEKREAYFDSCRVQNIFLDKISKQKSKLYACGNKLKLKGNNEAFFVGKLKIHVSLRYMNIWLF
jgi:hypothetical protein